MATGSVLASAAGYAYAGGAEAQGGATGSPGIVSGNSVQVPIEVPINLCGNTIDVIGALNPSFGNRCANVNHGGSHSAPKPAHSGRPDGATGGGGAGVDSSSTGGGWGTTTIPGAGASGVATGSAGVISGNQIQAPVHAPVNVCGNAVNVVGVANPAFGNHCANVEKAPPKPPAEGCAEACPTPPQTSAEEVPGVPRNGGPATAPAVASQSAQAPVAQLASTGAGQVELLGAAGLALLLGGGVLYRRARAGAR
ncbi:chaplin [Kitasatospora sp. NPDC101235]|uniref:chaplin n=1 Tax=Kitasatospora sp. NPDC101235 TaxID=3364101 RepID=UPI0038200CE4